MTKINLQSTSSIIDYLKFQKQDSSYSARKKLYTEQGLDKRLGTFSGSGKQNSALLNFLRKGEESAPTETPATHVTQVAQTFATLNQPKEDKPSFPFDISPTSKIPLEIPSNITAVSTPAVLPPKVSPTEIIDTIQGKPPKTDTYIKQAGVEQPPTLPQEVGKMVGEPTTYEQAKEQGVPPEQLDEATKTDLGFSASDFIPDIPDETTLVNDYLNSSEFALLLEKTELKNQTAEAKAEYAKQQLEAKYAGEKTSLENLLAERGLAFSGIRATQIKSLADSLAASQLNVDREFASKLLDADINFRESILKGVAELVSDAKDERKEAIDQLNKAGLAVVNGTLVPTLAALKEERTARSEEFKQELDIIKEERLQRQAALAKTQFVTVGGRIQLRDKQTGELIADIGASSTGTKTKLLTAEALVKDFNSNPILKGFVGQPREEVFELFTMEQPPTDFVTGFAGDSLSEVPPETIQEAWDELRLGVLNDLAGSPVEDQFSNNDIAIVQNATGLSFDEVKQMNPERFNTLLQEEKDKKDLYTIDMLLGEYSK